MKLITIGDIAINIDRIDWIAKDKDNPNRTKIYISGDRSPFVVNYAMDEIIEYIDKTYKMRRIK